jgi:hypothetical protein
LRTVEELKEIENFELEKLKKQKEEEKENFKLADYFVTIGIDDYHTKEEVQVVPEGFEEAKNIADAGS